MTEQYATIYSSALNESGINPGSRNFVSLVKEASESGSTEFICPFCGGKVTLVSRKSGTITVRVKANPPAAPVRKRGKKEPVAAPKKSILRKVPDGKRYGHDMVTAFCAQCGTSSSMAATDHPVRQQ